MHAHTYIHTYILTLHTYVWTHAPPFHQDYTIHPVTKLNLYYDEAILKKQDKP